MPERPDNGIAADEEAVVKSLSSWEIGVGYRAYKRFKAEMGDSSFLERDLLCSGKVVGILPLDVVRENIVLIRQFRLGSHVATGRGGMIEIPAGRVDSHESDHDAAMRECFEEIGIWPSELKPIMALMPAPALSDECMTLFVAAVDSSVVPKRAGHSSENEFIETMIIPFEKTLPILASGCVTNALLILALQWLALNRTRLSAGI